MNQFPIFINLNGRRVILLGVGEMADAKRRLYERAGAEITDDLETPDAALAVIAVEDDDEAAALTKKLKARGLLVNVVDRPELCDFTTPAIVDRDPVLIAIGTGGASAGLAKALRQRLERLLPATVGKLADALFAARGDIKRQWPDGSARRKAIDCALDPGGPLDPFSNDADANVAQWLKKPAPGAADKVVDLYLASREPDHLTIEQARLLGQADYIYAEAQIPEQIMNRARADALRFDLSEFDEGRAAGLTLLIRMRV